MDQFVAEIKNLLLKQDSGSENNNNIIIEKSEPEPDLNPTNPPQKKR